MYTYEDIQETESSRKCSVYNYGVPTFTELVSDPPPEYLPLLLTATIVMLANLVISGIAYRRHHAQLSGPAFVMALRTVMVLASFPIFAGTSYFGMMSLRSTQFLHCIANTFEAFCILFFYELMVDHLRVNGFINKTKSLDLRVPPCCCCLRCIPPVRATENNVKKLRIAIIATIIGQATLESFRVLRVFECAFEPSAPLTTAVNAGMLVGIMFAFWALFVVYKSGGSILGKYNYTVKFLAFKLMIIISKFLYVVLSNVAVNVEGAIDHHYQFVQGESGEKVLILKNKGRVSIWTNFISVVVSTVLLGLTFHLYHQGDYQPVLDAIERGEYGSSPAREGERKSGYQKLNGEPEGGVNTITSVQ